MSVNKVILVGNLGADPEVRSFSNGGRVCNMRVATSETWKDKASGERKERTEWHSVTIHADHAIDFAQSYLSKGSKVYIEGKLETRKWTDQSGADRYSTEIVVRPFGGEVQGLDKPQRDAKDNYESKRATGPQDDGRRPDIDDDIPF